MAKKPTAGNFQSKRRGTFMADALVAILIFAVITIPIAGAMLMGYGATVDSAQVTKQINEFYVSVESMILSGNLNTSASVGALISGDVAAEDMSENIISADILPPFKSMRLLRIQRRITTGARALSADTYVIRK